MVCVGQHWTRRIFKIPPRNNILILSRKLCWHSLPVQRAEMVTLAGGVPVSEGRGGSTQNRKWDGILASCLLFEPTWPFWVRELFASAVLPSWPWMNIWTRCPVEIKQQAPVAEPCLTLAGRAISYVLLIFILMGQDQRLRVRLSNNGGLFSEDRYRLSAVWRHDPYIFGRLHIHTLEKLILQEAPFHFHFLLDRRKVVDGSTNGQLLLFCSGEGLLSDVIKSDMINLSQWLSRLLLLRVTSKSLLDSIVLTQNHSWVWKWSPISPKSSHDIPGVPFFRDSRIQHIRTFHHRIFCSQPVWSPSGLTAFFSLGPAW